MLGDVTAVAIRTREQESARDLVRAREDCRGDLMSTRHRLSKLLLRRGIIYSGGKAWTRKHELWLRSQRFDDPALQLVYETCFEPILTARDRRDRLDRAIEEMAANCADAGTPLVPPPVPAASWPINVCMPGGGRLTHARNVPSWPTPRSLVNSLAGAGRWPFSTSNRH
jgi:transposase